ncbi:MAG: autotransporter-associated beta strand repeat-containing protein [Kiritimatiellia bacterium]|jgi:fibronectin-binding autotransporter adhesin
MKASIRFTPGFLVRGLPPLFIAVVLVVSVPGHARAGWNQTAAGTYDYLDPANWDGGTVDDTFPATIALLGAQTATFATNHATTGGMGFLHGGNYGLALRSDGAGAKTLTLGGDVDLATTGGKAANVTLGSATASQNLNLDLGGATRTFTVASGRTLTLQNTVANGGVDFAGAGTLVLGGANAYAGGTTINGGKLVSDANSGAPLGDVSSAVAINGGTLRLGLSGGSAAVPHPIMVGLAGGTIRGYRSKGLFTLGGPISGSGQLLLTKSEDWDTPSFILHGDIGDAVKLKAELSLWLSGNNTFTGGILFSGALRFSSHANLGGVDSALTTLAYNAGPIAVMGSEVSDLSEHVFSFASNTGLRIDIQDPDNLFTWDKNYDSGVNGASEPTFGKEGLGTMVVTVPQTYKNSDKNNKVVTRAGGGVLKVDYAAGGSLRNDQNNLGFASGTLHLLGKTDADTAQTFQKIKLETGGGALVADNNAGTGAMRVNLGGFSALAKPAAGSSLNIQAVNPGSGSVAVTTTDTNDVSGILSGGRIVFNGADWAAVADDTTIGAFTNYAVGLPSSGADGAANYSHAGGAVVTAGESVNTLKLGTTADGQSLAIGDGQVLTAGALLFTGDHDYAITGGSLAGSMAAGAHADLLLHHHGAGKLTIDSTITNGLGASTLTIAGPGTTELVGTNRNTGATFVSGGTLILSSDNQLNNGAKTALNLYNATLRATETFSTGRAVSLGGGGARFDIADGKTLTISGAVSGGRLILENRDAGSGTLVLSGGNSFSSGIEINGGILKLGNNSAVNTYGYNTLDFGTAPTQMLQINGARTVNVAGLKSASTTAVIENGASGDATLAVYNGAVNTFAGTLRDGDAGTLGLVKGGGLPLKLTGENTYTGPTTVLGGVLEVNGSLAAASDVAVQGGALGGTGTVNGAVTVQNGGAIAPGSGGVGALNTGALTFEPGAALEVEVGASGTDRVAVAGDLTLDGVVNVTGLEGFGTGIHTLMTYTGTLVDNGMEVGTTPDSDLAYSVWAAGGVVRLRVGAPATTIIVR